MLRNDERKNDELRQINCIKGFIGSAPGSVLMECGRTRVICTATMEEKVPPFLVGTGKGWLTAEYAMLPASTGARKQRDGARPDGRSVEIQRLIGRSLRTIVDLSTFGERTIRVDCDVIEADGGTRTASINGAFIALALLIDDLLGQGTIKTSPIIDQVAAISVGIVDEVPMLDLCYTEDSSAQVDMNLVMTGEGKIIEIQGTGEKRAFDMSEMQKLIDLAQAGIKNIFEKQNKILIK